MSENEGQINENIKLYDWMIRPCVVYYDEYSECSSVKGKFHQYFIYGETLDCSQWKIDYGNCRKWEKTEDKIAANDVIESERKRKAARLKGHYDNDIWTTRSEPLKDWNKPLPDHIVARHSSSLLALKGKELSDGTTRPSTWATLTCSIM